MARPSGSVKYNELEALATTDYDDGNIFVVYRIPEMPAEWQDTGLSGKYPKVIIKYEVTITGTSVDIYLESRISNTNYIDDEKTVSASVSVPSWRSDVTADKYPKTYTFASFPTAPRPRYAVSRVRIKEDSGGDGRVQAIYIRTPFDDTSYSDEVELTEHGTAADRVYIDDYPASAWHIRNLIMKTLNTFLYYSFPSFTVPVNGGSTS